MRCSNEKFARDLSRWLIMPVHAPGTAIYIDRYYTKIIRNATTFFDRIQLNFTVYSRSTTSIPSNVNSNRIVLAVAVHIVSRLALISGVSALLTEQLS